MNPFKKMSVLALTGTLLVTPALLTGCASSGPSAEPDITKAKTVIEQAERDGTRDFAAYDLNEAKTKLKEANKMMSMGKNRQARYLSEEARVEAELAMAKARTAKSKEAEKQLDQSMDSLQNAVDKTGNSPQ